VRLRCPVSKFIAHTISHFLFLVLLTVASFGPGQEFDVALGVFHGHDTNENDHHEDEQLFILSLRNLIKDDNDCHMHQLQVLFRHTQPIINIFQIVIIFWILGQLHFALHVFVFSAFIFLGFFPGWYLKGKPRNFPSLDRNCPWDHLRTQSPDHHFPSLPSTSNTTLLLSIHVGAEVGLGRSVPNFCN